MWCQIYGAGFNWLGTVKKTTIKCHAVSLSQIHNQRARPGTGVHTFNFVHKANVFDQSHPFYFALAFFCILEQNSPTKVPSYHLIWSIVAHFRNSNLERSDRFFNRSTLNISRPSTTMTCLKFQNMCIPSRKDQHSSVAGWSELARAGPDWHFKGLQNLDLTHP